MAKQIYITPYKLTKPHKTAITHYLLGKVSLAETSKRMGITKQRVYTMLAVIMRHSSTTGRINIEEILRDY
jgi:predicted DNA-binding protein YlxM (UPF0122 family)